MNVIAPGYPLTCAEGDDKAAGEAQWRANDQLEGHTRLVGVGGASLGDNEGVGVLVTFVHH